MQDAYEFTITLKDQVSNTLNQVGGGLNSMHRKLMDTKVGWQQLGQQMLYLNQAAQAIEGANRALEGLTRPGVEFQSSLADLKAITGLADEQVQKLGKSARAMAKEFGTDGAKGVESYKLLLSQLGPELAKTPEVLNQMARNVGHLSKTMGGDTVAATQVLTTAMNQFQVDLSDPIKAVAEMDRMMNAMSASAKYGSAELPALQAALSNSGLAAKTSNVSFEETLTYLQVLNKAGREGAQGGTAFSAVIGRLSRGDFMTPKTAQMLDAAGISMSTLADTSLTLTERLTPLKAISHDGAMMQQLFGESHWESAVAMIAAIDGADEFTESIRGTNTTVEQSEVIMGTHAERMKRLQARFSDFGISVFNATKNILPYTAALGQSAQLMVQMGPLYTVVKAGFIKAYQGTVMAIRGLRTASVATLGYVKALSAKRILLSTVAAAKVIYGAAVGAITGKITIATAAQIAFNAAFKASPFGWIVLGITAVATAFTLLKRRTDDATAAQKTLKDVQLRASDAIASEKVEVERLVSVMHDENYTKEQKRQAYQRLIDISPEYFGKLTFEEALTDKLKTTAEAYTDELLRKAKIKASEDMLVELYKELNKIEEDGLKLNAEWLSRKGTTFWQEQWNNIKTGHLGLFNLGGFNKAQESTIAANTEKAVNELTKKETTLKAKIKSLVKPNDLIEDMIGSADGKVIDPFKTIIDKDKENESEISRGVSSITSGGARATNIHINMGNLIESFVVHTQSIKEGADEIKDRVIEALHQVLNSANAMAKQA
jgi:TP901 family phage tail tape measure protein